MRTQLLGTAAQTNYVQAIYALTAELYERSEYGDWEPESTELDGSALRSYQDQIMAELVKNRMPEETERGLMYWYGKADSINTKVHSAVFTVEELDRQL